MFFLAILVGFIVIIIRYFIKEIFKSQFAILLILFIIFFSQKFVRILSSVIKGELSVELLFPLLALGFAQMIQLILPLSLFLAILVAFGRLYSESEMVALFACGGSKKQLYLAVFFLAMFSTSLSFINNHYWVPQSIVLEKKILQEAKENPNLVGVVAGQFQSIQNGKISLYINDSSEKNLNQIFLAQFPEKNGLHPTIITATRGKIFQHKNGEQEIVLEIAKTYDLSENLKEGYKLGEFKNYRAILEYKESNLEFDELNDYEHYSIFELYERKSNSVPLKTEFHWRLTLIFAVGLMAFLVIPLSKVNTRQGKVASFFPAFILYLTYFLLQTTIRANGFKAKLDPVFWFWFVNISYLVLAILLNFYDSLFVRKIKNSFRKPSKNV